MRYNLMNKGFQENFCSRNSLFIWNIRQMPAFKVIERLDSEQNASWIYTWYSRGDQ